MREIRLEMSALQYDNTYAVVDLDVLAENFRVIRQKAGVPVMAVIKANAYGHGAVQVARLLREQCAFFGVATLSEALELRQAGLDNPILILGKAPACAFSQMIAQGIRPAIFTYEDAEALSAAAQALGMAAPFHFAVDTGMSRIGFQVTEESADVCAKIAELPGLVAEGLFSHFFAADSWDLTQAREQAARFDRFDAMLRARGVQVQLRHLDNSAGIMNFENHYEMVRSGIITYGLYPSDQVDPGLLEIKPILSWYSRVSYVKTLPAGRTVGYGATFTAERPTVVATIPVGYADGYSRSLSNRFHVLIRGKKAPILGRVCMDQMMVDVTDIPGVREDDPVVLVGTDGEETITMEAISAQAGSFNYEFPCTISRRVPRWYRRGGKIVEEANYLLEQ